MKGFIVFLLIVFSTSSFAEHKSIYIILSGGDEIYYKIATALVDNLDDSQLTLDQIKIITVEDSSFKHINPTDLIVAIGEKAAEKSLSYQASNAIIYGFVEQELIDKIRSGSLSQQWAAAIINQPVDRLVAVADKLVKNKYKNKIIILVSKNNIKLKQDIASISSLNKGRIEVLEIESGDAVAKVVEKSLFNAAALIATHDQAIWSGSNAKWLLRQAYNYQVPVIGNSKRFLKAGALISVYSSMEQISETTSILIKQWHNDGKIINVGSHYSSFQLDVNKNVAQALHFDKDFIEMIRVEE